MSVEIFRVVLYSYYYFFSWFNQSCG